MDFTPFSELLFAVGRRAPRVPLALLRALPPAVLATMQRAGFRRTLRAAHASSPYYRTALARAGVDVMRARRPEDLGDFFLTPDVVKSRPDDLLCGTPELAIESSGTSGHVTTIYLSRRELEYNARQGNLLYTLYGLDASDRLLSTLDLGFGLGSLLVERGVRYTGLFAMVAGRVDPMEAYARMARYGITVVVSDPFWLARLTDIARTHGRPSRLKLLIGGGEGVTDRTRHEIETFWEAPLCMTYASTEAATVLGFECPERTGYHVNEFDFALEVDRPDAMGYGEVILTTVNRHVMPLVRYRTGDIARWEPGPCRCGLPFRRLSMIRGRTDEQVSCAWGNVHPEFFVPLLAGVPALGPDWQVALYERDLSPVMQFRLELHGTDHALREGAVHVVLGALQRTYPEAWLAYCQRLIDVEFSFFAPDTLRRRRKLLRVVDERGIAVPEWAQQPVVAAPPR
jgi:phenylacetate-CoA ligase